MSLSTASVRDKALELGFDLFGVAPARQALHAAAFHRWLQAGYAADMMYMQRAPERRADPRLVLPECRSVVVVGISYYVAEPPAHLWNDPARGRIARYAWGPDYHTVMEPMLAELLEFIRLEIKGEIRAKAYVDTGPVLERSFGAAAGLGFIGKNTCLISPTLGSYVFLGEVLLDVELEADPHGATTAAKVGTCGRCTRCLTACPTEALVAPYELDSRRCISYLTIENRASIPIELRTLMGNWIFGCDACQSICPWPRRVARPKPDSFLHFSEELCIPPLLTLVALSEAEFAGRYRRSAVWRAKRIGLLRNVCVALGNWGTAEAVPGLEHAMAEAEPLVRSHAAWALGRVGTARAQGVLSRALRREMQASVLAEIQAALAGTHQDD